MIQLPLFETASDWLPPHSLPDLSDAKEIAIDTENKDPLLTSHGPGYIRRDGYVAGVSVATDTGWSGYLPIAHEGGGNLDRNVVSRWLAKQTARADRRYIFANAQYDLGWLRTLDVEVRGTICDIAVGAALLDEEDRNGYSLDALGKRYVGRGKSETLLRDAARNWGVDPKAGLWQLHAKHVGAYGQDDAVLTLKTWQAISPALAKENLWPIMELEQAVTPILFEMFWKGINLDLNYGDELNSRWLREENRLLQEVDMRRDEIWTPQRIVRYCQKHRIEFPRTAKGNPSITAHFMENSGHPALLPLRKVRAINRTRKTFLEDVILKGHIRGRLHPQYVQLACDDGGTRTGRLSCRNPNAQQVPKRSTLFDAKAIRKVMRPEAGEVWAKYDYWSQEPTLQVHYALKTGLKGAAKVADQFKNKVKLYTIIERATKGKCSYDHAKAVVLARSYGQQLKSMARGMGIPENDALVIQQEFDEAAPYIAQLAEDVQASAACFGHVVTVLGRKLHFKHWQPAGSRGELPLEWEEAKKAWPNVPLELAWLYKALNKLIQGSAADQAKKAVVVSSHKYSRPCLLVHDELNFSLKDPSLAEPLKHTIENAVPLLCPAQVDMDVGPSWL